MSDRWAARFPRASVHAALPLRLRPSVKACEEGDFFWLTANGGFEEIDPLLRRIADVVRFTVNADNSITQIGRRIPDGALPLGPWEPFATMVQLHPQPAALPAKTQSHVQIKLVRASSFSGRPEVAHSTPSPVIAQAGRPGIDRRTAISADRSPAFRPGLSKKLETSENLGGHDSDAMVVSISQWTRYVITAPNVRLNPLRFAVHADGRALILGNPLPPLQGAYFVNLQGLIIPSGYQFDSPLEPQILRRAMNLAKGDLALFDIDGTYEAIPAESILSASRSAARLTAANFAEAT